MSEQLITGMQLIVSSRLELTELEDVASPLAGLPYRSGWSALNLIFAVATLALMGILMARWLGKRKSERQGSGLREKPVHSAISHLPCICSILPAALAVLSFLSTQDIRGKVVIVDNWTYWMAALLLTQVILLFVTERGREEEAHLKV